MRHHIKTRTNPYQTTNNNNKTKHKPTAVGPIPLLGRAGELALMVKAGVGELKDARVQGLTQLLLGCSTQDSRPCSSLSSRIVEPGTSALAPPLASCSTV